MMSLFDWLHAKVGTCATLYLVIGWVIASHDDHHAYYSLLTACLRVAYLFCLNLIVNFELDVMCV